MINPYREIVREKLFSLQSYYSELAELEQITFERILMACRFDLQY